MKKRSQAARAAYYLGPLVVWTLVIFGFSSDRLSADRTDPMVGGTLRRILPFLADRLSDEQIRRINWNIRKITHVTVYAILAMLAYRGVVYGNPRFRNRHVLLPLLYGIVVASLDEYHQSLYPTREGRAADVFFDTSGVVTGLLICLWLRAAREQKQEDDARLAGADELAAAPPSLSLTSEKGS